MLDITDMFSKNICHKTIMSRVCSKYCNNITEKCIVERGNSACLNNHNNTKLLTLLGSYSCQDAVTPHIKLMKPGLEREVHLHISLASCLLLFEWLQMLCDLACASSSSLTLELDIGSESSST